MNFQVIQYQNNGESIVTSRTLSFNDACEEYGVVSNPMKKHLHGTLWKRQNAFIDFETLPEDLVSFFTSYLKTTKGKLQVLTVQAFYSAADVESLLDLYDLTMSLVDYDFKPLMDDLNDGQMIKAMDAENENTRNRIRHRFVFCDVFIIKLHSSKMFSLPIKIPDFRGAMCSCVASIRR